VENFNWTQYLIILSGAIFGALCIMPYTFQLNKDKLAEAPMSLPKLALISAIQGIIVFAIVTFLGLNATNAIGLSITSTSDALVQAIILGVIATVLLISIEVFIFQPHLPEALKDTKHTIPFWKRFLAIFYGGISEEVLTRLFLVSGLTWLLMQITQANMNEVIGFAIIISAILFGVLHLPATASITPITPLIIVRAIALNAIIGLLCGWLFWQYGFATAVIAHLSADVVLHLMTPPLLKQLENRHQKASIKLV